MDTASGGSIMKKFKKIYIKDGKKRIVRYGAKGYRIYPGTKRGDSYCARSFGILKKYQQKCNLDDKYSPNCLSRTKWRCKGKKSLRKR